MLTNNGDISTNTMNEEELMSDDEKKFLYARAVHSNPSIQYHMHQIIEHHRVVNEYRKMMMEGMNLIPLESNIHKYDLVIMSQIKNMIKADNVWNRKTFESVMSDLQNMWMEGICELENTSMHCTNNDQNINEMEGVEVIDLCSVSQNKNEVHSKGKENTKQESHDKMKPHTTDRMESELKANKGKSMTINGKVETVMMCWEAMNNFTEEEPHKEAEKVEKKPVEKTEKLKHEEEHVVPYLKTGNRLKISIEEYSWERDTTESTLDTEEPKQQQLVCITNLKNGLQKDSTKLYNEEGPNEKKPAAKNWLIEKPTLNNPIHVYEVYVEYGSDNDNIEDSLKGENKKNSNEENYTNMDEKKEGKRADLLNMEKSRYHHDIPRKNGENDIALVTKEMTRSNLGENIFIVDSAATSHTTSKKLGVYNLVPINGSVMIGNGQSISCTHKEKLDVICKHKDEFMARETWDVKIVPQLNHDLFSFTKAMKEGLQMTGRWKEGGLAIELLKTSRASMQFDRMVPSGASWLMGIKVQRVLDHAHSVMEPGKTISIAKLHQITGQQVNTS